MNKFYPAPTMSLDKFSKVSDLLTYWEDTLPYQIRTYPQRIKVKGLSSYNIIELETAYKRFQIIMKDIEPLLKYLKEIKQNPLLFTMEFLTEEMISDVGIILSHSSIYGEKKIGIKKFLEQINNFLMEVDEMEEKIKEEERPRECENEKDELPDSKYEEIDAKFHNFQNDILKNPRQTEIMNLSARCVFLVEYIKIRANSSKYFQKTARKKGI